MISTKTSATDLLDAVEQSDKRLDRFVKSRKFFLDQYTGKYYTRESDFDKPETKNPEPLNTIFSMVSTMVPHLAYSNPHTLVTTSKPELRFQAESLGLALEHLIREINFVDTMRMAVTEALFSFAVIRTGLCPGAEVEGLGEPEGYLHDIGQPFADLVDVADYILDPNCRYREQCAFEGNRYRLPLEYVMDSGLFQKTDGLKAYEPKGERGTDDLSRGGADHSRLNEFTQYIDLIDLWLPHENVIVTMPVEECGPSKYIKEVDWEGPERGPYEMLGYHWVPSNALPLAPVMTWFDLHIELNIMARKMGRQAERQKTVLLYEPTAAEDAQTVVNASDGDAIRVQDVSRVREAKFGGQDASVMEAIGWFKSATSEMAGNIDLLGGKSAQSPTASQDAMLMNSATLRVDDMREQVQLFTKRICGKLAEYLWTNPLIDLPQTKRVGGIEIDYGFKADELDGEFPDYDIDIEPTSMAHRSPEQQYQKKAEFIQNILTPLAQLGLPIGQGLDLEKVAASLAKDLDIADADEWWIPVEPMGVGPDGAMGGEMGPEPMGGGAAGGAPSPTQYAPDGAMEAPVA